VAKKQPKQKRVKWVQMRATPEEKAALASKAKQAGKALGAYLRERGLAAS
jgi:hypothetical protein